MISAPERKRTKSAERADKKVKKVNSRSRKDYRNSNGGLEDFERFARGKVGKENHTCNSTQLIT